MKDQDPKGGSLKVPLLPLRDVVVFPHMIVPLFVGREKSIAALETAMKSEKEIFMVAQKNAQKDEPSENDIYRVGTLGIIIQLLRLPDGTVKVLVEGKQRGVIREYLSDEEFFHVSVDEVPDVDDANTIRSEALIRSIREAFETYAKLSKKVHVEIIGTIASIDEPSKLADIVVSHLSVKLEDKQKILEIFNVTDRLETIYEMMLAEIEILEVEEKIKRRVKKQMEKTQKDYYLNEQMRAIQKEMGEKDDFKSEIAELEKRLKNKKLSEEAQKKVKAEIKKMQMMAPMSAEATVVRNYIDWLLDLPWYEKTENKYTLKESEAILEEDHFGLKPVKERILEYLAVQSLVKKNKGSILCLVGPPGVGKTTLLREAARVLADELGKRVVVVDTSNEIAGDGDVPHPGIGHARRMQVPSPDRQHAVMIEAVENHMPEVIVIDEIGNELEAAAARTIAERGVQLVATAHGMTLDNLLMNPTLSDLVGGVQAVTLSDEEARRRGTQKTILERKAPPTFDILVEIQNRDRLAIYADTARVVDDFLAGYPLRPEIRVREKDGKVEILENSSDVGAEDNLQEFDDGGLGAEDPQVRAGRPLRRRLRIYPIGISRTRLEKAIRELGIPARLADQPLHADMILSLKAQRKKEPKKLQQVLSRGVEFHTIRSNTLTQIRSFLAERFPGRGAADLDQDAVDSALTQAEDAVVRVQRSGQPIELAPQDSYRRRLQHALVQEHGLRSESVGEEPFRRVVVFPD